MPDKEESPYARKTWVLHLKAEPDNPEPILSMRRLLKFALRSCGWRCVNMTSLPNEVKEP